jgi:CRP-like cAMP-binding protein
MKVISDKSLMLNKKVEYLSIKSIRGKICTYLLEQSEITKGNNIILPLKRNELADFLNVSRPSMSREMCQMRDEGIIDFHLSTFRIKDIDALKSFCD